MPLRVLVRPVVVAGVTALAMSPALATRSAQSPAGASRVFDVTMPSGDSFDKAEFRLWVPETSERLRAAVVLVPGSNGDGRSMATDEFWQAFATTHHLALVGCRLTDKPHDQSFIEEYVDVSRGAGPALEEAMRQLAAQAKRPELAAGPLLLWGMSAGGQFNYEFVAWKPERVAAFIVNKGGIYYSALVSRAAREVPGILFVGEADLAFRTNTIAGLFAVNRRAGARWAYASEPGAAHVVGRSRDMGAILFEEVLPLRLGTATPGPDGAVALQPIAHEAGFIGDLSEHTFAPATGRLPGVPTAWLPTERTARAWQAVVTGQPFER